MSFAQKITVQFLGNCGLYLTDGKEHIYIDFPYKSGAYGYMKYAESSLDSLQENAYFLFTHKHADHYSRKNVKKQIKQNGGKKYGVFKISKLQEFANSIDNFEIKAFKTKHSFFGIPFRHYSFLITWHGKRIFLSGDTTEPETIGNIKNIDWAYIPPWILYYAKQKNISIDAKMQFIYHLYPSEIPDAQKQWKKTKNIHPLTKIGETFTLE
jgi:L-ascorbate metabolism protein UlaG (beta-lactamase superfamily)